MRRILICTGVLGGGTALVFGAAALTAVLIPPSRIVPQNQGIMIDSRGGWVGPAPQFGGGVMVDSQVIVKDAVQVEAPVQEVTP